MPDNKMINRRSLITGLISLAAAPAIVRASSLMPVKVIKPTHARIITHYKGALIMLDISYGTLHLNNGLWEFSTLLEGLDYD